MPFQEAVFHDTKDCFLAYKRLLFRLQKTASQKTHIIIGKDTYLNIRARIAISKKTYNESMIFNNKEHHNWAEYYIGPATTKQKHRKRLTTYRKEQ